MLEVLLLLLFTEVPNVGRCGCLKWRRWNHMNPYIAPCTEKPDEGEGIGWGVGGWDTLNREKERRKKVKMGSFV